MCAKFDQNRRGSRISLVDFIWNDPFGILSLQIPILYCLGLQMLADCLLECHRNGLRAGTPLQLRVFVSGRGRLEDVGAAALAETFKVIKVSCLHRLKRENTCRSCLGKVYYSPSSNTI